MDWKVIGQNIRKKRKEKSWKQATLAEKTDLTTAYISLIERGEKIPKLETFVKIANVLDTTADELMGKLLNKQYEIETSEYIDKIKNLSSDDQKMVYEILEILLKYCKKRR